MGGPWKNLLKAFMESKNMKPEDLEKHCQEAGFNMP